MSDRPIGLFDSGVGGLSVFQEIRTQMPHENIAYFADTLHMPYGPRTPHEIKQLVFAILDFLQRQEAKLVIMACNTSSALALELAREHFSIPILGMIRPVAEALANSSDRALGVLATEATIRSNQYAFELKAAGYSGEVISQPCPKLASLIEQGRFDDELRQAIHDYLQPMQTSAVKKIILGCTHYPFAASMIKEQMGYAAELINPATYVVSEAKALLSQSHMLRLAGAPRFAFYTSGDKEVFSNRAEKLITMPVQTERACFSANAGMLRVDKET